MKLFVSFVQLHHSVEDRGSSSNATPLIIANCVNGESLISEYSECVHTFVACLCLHLSSHFTLSLCRRWVCCVQSERHKDGNLCTLNHTCGWGCVLVDAANVAKLAKLIF